MLDKDGLASSYLVLTAMIPIAFYYLYTTIYSKSVMKCTCDNCLRFKRKQKKYSYICSFILQAFFWLLLAYLVKNILTIQIQKKSTAFDPYSVLEVTKDSSIKEIKKSFRKLSKFLSRKEATKDEKEESLRNLNKAYALLKDPKKMLGWISEDTNKELLIALPSFLLDFVPILICLYVLLFVVALPYYIFRYYASARKHSFSGSSYEANEIFLDNIEKISDIPNIAIQNILYLMSKSPEFAKLDYKSLLKNDQIDEFINYVETTYSFPIVRNDPAYIYILMYLFRKLEDPNKCEYIRSKCLSMIKPFIKIALANSKPKIFECLLDLQKMFSQAIFSPTFYLCQYPNVKFTDIIKNDFDQKNEKLNDSEILSKCLDSEQLKKTLKIFDIIPRISIKEFSAYTSLDLEEDLPKKENDAFIIERNASPTFVASLFCSKSQKYIHCPFSSENTNNSWIIYFVINNKINENVIFLDHFEGNKKIKFSSNELSGNETVKLCIISNGYFGNDTSAKLLLKTSA